MDPRQRTLVGLAIRSNLGRMEERLRRREPFATVEVTEFLGEIEADELDSVVLHRLLDCLPASTRDGLLGSRPEWAPMAVG